MFLEQNLPTPPKKTELSKEKSKTSNLLGLIFGILMIIAVIPSLKENPIGTIIFILVIILAMIGSSIPDKSSSQFREIQLKEYQKKLHLYQQSKAAFDKNKLKVEWLLSRKKVALRELLFSAKRAELDCSNPKVGRSEVGFLRYLDKYFPNCVKVNKTIEFFDSVYNFSIPTEELNGYVPDFYFHELMMGLNIDIEIDEPYYETNNPIHYLRNKHDSKRNDYFLENGWIIIRFSEEQILTSPLSCCREIAEIIFEITNDSKYITRLKDHPKLYRTPRWTH